MHIERLVMVDDERGRLVADVIDGEVFLHFKDCKFTKDAMAYYRTTFDGILSALKSAGIGRVFAAPFYENSWAVSFVRSFGFKEYGRHGNQVLMVRATIGDAHG